MPQLLLNARPRVFLRMLHSMLSASIGRSLRSSLNSTSSTGRLLLLDNAWPNDVDVAHADRLVVYTSCRRSQRTEASFELAPWSTDDLLEYLLAFPVHGVLLVDMEQRRVHRVDFPSRFA